MAGAEPRLAIDGAIATVTLRRPEVANRLEPQDLAALQAQLAEVDASPTARVLLLRGEGRHFCSGFDVGRIDADGARAGPRFEALADALERARPVTVVALQGGAYGGAVDLALAADFRVGCDASELMIPAARLGLHFHRSGLERLVRRAGLALARRLRLATDAVRADALEAAGLLDRRAASADAVDDAAARLAAQLAALAPLALLPMKRHLNRIARGTLDAAALAADVARTEASADLREGVLAWREKRAPVFTGT